MSISLRSIVSWQNASNEACNVHRLEAVADDDEVVADEEAASNEEAANEEEVTDILKEYGIKMSEEKK